MFKVVAKVTDYLVYDSLYIVQYSGADSYKKSDQLDKSMKLGTWFLDIPRSILRNGAISDLTFGDL